MKINRIHKRSKVAVLAALLLLFIVLETCRNIFGSNTNNELKSIAYISSYAALLYHDDGKVKIWYLTDTDYIFYSNSYILYRLPPIRRMEDDSNIKGTEPYFIYRKGEGYGFYFKDSAAKAIRLRADSFRRQTAMGDLTFIPPPDSTWILTRSFRNKKRASLIEEYGARKQNQGLQPDSCYFYFDDQLKPFDYTFSKILDSIKGIKLYKVRMIYNQRDTVPKREYLWEIIKTPPAETKGIKELIQRFSKVLPE